MSSCRAARTLILVVNLGCLWWCTNAVPAQEGSTGPGSPAGGKVEINDGHNLLQESKAGDSIGVSSRPISGLAFKDVDGKAYYLDELSAQGPTVLAFLSTECPVAKRYTQRLNRFQEQFSPRGVALLGVFSNEEDSTNSIQQHARQMGFTFPVIKDVGGYLAGRLGATMTPQVFVIDQSQRLRYRGCVDDNRYEDRVKEHYLIDAVKALLAGGSIAHPETRALGCTIHRSPAADAEQITYSSHVARILQDNCQSCHRPGQVGPFSLVGYEQAKRWATEIKKYTHARLMPPWKPLPGFGKFKEDRSLSDEQIAVIARWVDDGMLEGDVADAPPPAKFRDEWARGEPDLIVEMPEPYVVDAEGEDDYRHFIIPTSLDRDVYVEAIDVQPGNRSTVHHVLVYVDKSGKARELDAADPGPGYTNFGGPGFDPISGLGGWAPGSQVAVLPTGTGRWLPQGADVVLQVHYYRTGAVERDRTRVGLYFSKSPDPVRVRTAAAINTRFEIPPGEQRYEVRAEWKVPVPLYVIGTFPHMHLLGREMKVTAELENGEILPFIWINDWDFSWQQGYQFEKLQFLPKGTKVRVVAYFDNSADNPNNPHNPPKPVGWGEKTTDEMCIAFLTFVSAAEYDKWKATHAVAAATRPEP